MRTDHLLGNLAGALGLVAMGVLLLSAPGCKHEPIELPVVDDGGGGGNNGGLVDPGLWITPINTDPCSPDSVYFQNTVFPLLVSYCASAGCHDNITHAEGVRLYDYAHIMNDVEPGSPGQSNIWSDGIQDGMPPQGHPQTTSAQEQAIYQWILQGAQNNSCNGCDTTNVTYSATIRPIFQNKCVGCHGGNNPSGGLNLTTWSACNTIALNSQLEGTVKHLTNYSPMPPFVDGSYLPACDIYKLMIWKRQGAPNN